ncbi:MAG: preprotein translocase subunit SecE, partial [Caldimicrobium sp.]
MKIKELFLKIKRFLKEVIAETKKTTWLNKKEIF